MKIVTVAKPTPSQSVLQIQKNNLIRRINSLENSSEQGDYAKAVYLKMKLEEIGKKHDQKTEIEKKELRKNDFITIENHKEVVSKLESFEQKRMHVTSEDNEIISIYMINKKLRSTTPVLGKNVDKTV
jgi:hypothetical protein